MMMDIRPIRTEADHAWALKEAETYFISPPRPQTAEGDRFDLLVDLIEKYEAEHFVIAEPDPIEAIKARMDDLGFTRRTFCQAVEISEGRLSEILNRKRTLSVAMIRSFSRVLRLPVATLVKEYPLLEMA